MKSFNFYDYIRIPVVSLCVISDCGPTAAEEASLLNLPTITMRNVHECTKGLDAGTQIMSGPTVTKQVLRIVQSYTDYVNRTV